MLFVNDILVLMV